MLIKMYFHNDCSLDMTHMQTVQTVLFEDANKYIFPIENFTSF